MPFSGEMLCAIIATTNIKEGKVITLLRIENIKITPEGGPAALTEEAARILKIKAKDILWLKVLRRSIDAREDVALVYTVEVDVREEAAVLKRCHSKKVSKVTRKPGYLLPVNVPEGQYPPVVAGAGPAGLFAALVLAMAGFVASKKVRFN